MSDASRILFYGSRNIDCCSCHPVISFVTIYVVRRGKGVRGNCTNHSCHGKFRFVASSVISALTHRTISGASVLFGTIGPGNNRVPIIVKTNNSNVLLRRTVKRTFRTSFGHGHASVFYSLFNGGIYGRRVGIISSNAVTFGHKTIGFSSRNIRNRGACVIGRNVLADCLRSHVDTGRCKITPAKGKHHSAFHGAPVPHVHTACVRTNGVGRTSVVSAIGGNVCYSRFAGNRIRVNTKSFAFFIGSNCLVRSNGLARPIGSVGVVNGNPGTLTSVAVITGGSGVSGNA